VLNARQTKSILQVCLGVNTSKVDLSSFNKAERLIYKGSLEDSLEALDGSSEPVHPAALAGQELESVFGARTTEPLDQTEQE